MIHTIYKYVCAATLLLSLIGCGDFLKEYSQDTDYVDSWEDLNELLIGSCYLPQYQSNTLARASDNQYFLHFLGDELDENLSTYDDNYMEYDGKERVFGYFTWQARSGQNDSYTGYTTENGNWEQMYKLINVANNVIYSVSKLKQNDCAAQMGKLKVDGEARFLRAYYYFFLANLYGKAYDPATAATDLAVPIKTSEEVEDKSFRRNTVQEVYDLVLTDLDIADKELTTYGAQPSKFRADSVAVHFLKSRVYLYMQNWEMAARYAQKVIDEHPTLQNLNALNQKTGLLNATSPELIFSMGGNAMPCYTMNYIKSFTITDKIYGLYSDNDLRKNKYIWTNGDFHGYAKVPIKGTDLSQEPTAPQYYFYAYYSPYAFNYAADISDKFCFRTAEAYLIKAEAEAYMGHEDAARQTLNTLRAQRYASGTNYAVTTTGDDLIKTIRNERERELCLEGQRWFDLRRYRVCQVLPQKEAITHHYYYYENRNSSTRTALHTFTLGSDDWGWVLPIPQEVLDINSGMKNNERGTRTYTSTAL